MEARVKGKRFAVGGQSILRWGWKEEREVAWRPCCVGGGRGEAVPDLGGKLRRKSVCGSVCGVQS